MKKNKIIAKHGVSIVVLASAIVASIASYQIYNKGVQEQKNLANLVHYNPYYERSYFGFGQINYISIDVEESTATRFESEDLLIFQQFSNLQRLRLRGFNISDSDVEKLLPLRNLKELDLSDTNITSNSAEYFSQFPHLRRLDLCGTKFGIEASWELMEKSENITVFWHE